MTFLASIIAIVLRTLLSLAMSNPAQSPRTETLWRGSLGGDSLYLRASWIPTVGSATCFAQMGGTAEDTQEVIPKYLGYRLEDSGGRTSTQEGFGGEDFGVCVYDLSARSSPWREGLMVRIDAMGRGCEPAGDCDLRRYLYVSLAGHVARSEWTKLEWDPRSEGAVDGVVDDGCLAYGISLQLVVRDSALVFEPTFASETKSGDFQEREVTDDVPVRCGRHGPHEAARVDWFDSPGDVRPKSVLVEGTDRIEIVSVVIRALRASSGDLRPVIDRIGVRLNGRQGYLSRASLKTLGFTNL